MFSQVSTGMDDHLRVGIPSRYVTKPITSTQGCIPPWSLNRVPALVGWDKAGMSPLPGGRWCDPIWHASSNSNELGCITAICIYLYLLPVCLSHTRVLSKSPNKSICFRHRNVARFIINCVGREFGYIQNNGYFPL